MAKLKMRVVAAEIVGGRRIIDVPFLDGSVEDTLNGIGSLSVSVPVYDFDVRALDLRVSGAPSRTFLGLIINDRFQQLGPIWKHSYDRSKRVLNMTAANTWSYWNYRALLGLNSDTVPLLLPDGRPNPATNFDVTGTDLGTIAKRAVQAMNDRPGQALPMVYEPDRPGTSERHLLGADLKYGGSFLSDLTNVENGPDIRFDGRWNSARDGVEVVMRTGTAAEPRLFQPAVHRWDLTVSESVVRNLQVDIDGQNMADVAWTTGGRSNDVVLMDRQFNPKLREQKYPRLDYVDTSHSSVVVPATLQEYGRETVRKGSVPTGFISFEVRGDASPIIGEYQVGDYCTLKVKNDPYLPDGKYLRRIVQISANLKGKWIKITTGETEWNLG
jgi:hypothetical protein